jgi:hypothetical protein
MIEHYGSVDVFVDVAKEEHQAVAYDRAGKVLFDGPYPTTKPNFARSLES